MKRRTTRDKSRKKSNETCLLFIDVAKNDLLALKFGTNVVVVMIYLSSPRTKQTTWNWSNDRRFRRKFYIIFRVLFLPFSTYNPINFIDFASEWSNSQCIKSCDRLQILVGIDGVCSELHVVDWSILVDFLPRKSNLHTECWWDKHSVWRVTSRISNIDQTRRFPY